MNLPSLKEQLKFQREWRDHVKENLNAFPESEKELAFAQAILESLERLDGLND